MVDSAAAPQLPADQPRQSLFHIIWGVAATAMSLLCTIVLAPFAALSAILQLNRAVSGISWLWARTILLVCGIRIEIEGIEKIAGLQSCVVAANHQSLFDILAVLAWMPGQPRFVAKKELRKIPLIGLTMERSGHIMVDREQGGRAIRKAIKTARRGHGIYVFAEGTRFADNQVHEFGDGAAWIAIASGLPCVPMAISGSGRIFPRGARFVVPGMKIMMRIGEPIETRGMKGGDRVALTQRLEDDVRAAFVA